MIQYLAKTFGLKLKIMVFAHLGQFLQLMNTLKKIKFENFIPKSLKYLTVAGGKTKKTLEYILKTCKKNNIKFFVMYGQTEASPRMSYFDLTKYPEKLEVLEKL